jgi:putative oxidoreductase
MTYDHASTWLRSHRPFIADLIRIYLGIGLLIKGIFFLSHPDSLSVAAGSLPASAVNIVPYIHIIGGLFLALGLATRVAAVIQIPLVADALFAVHLPRMTGMQMREAFEFSSLTLFLLVLIAIWGGGPLSVDHRLTARREALRRPSWLSDHSDLFMDLIRAYLGIGLFVKGLYILQHEAEFQGLVQNTGSMSIALMAAAHYIIPVHFVGGAMLLFGLATRLAALAQIPLLVGAIFYVYLPRFSTLELRQNLEFTGLVLFLLCILSAYGSGRYSLDYILNKTEPKPELGDYEHAAA